MTHDGDPSDLARTLVGEAWAALGGGAPPRVSFTGPAVTLPAALPVTALAGATVAAATLAAAELAEQRGATPSEPTVDSGAVAVAFTSERHLRVDGRPVTVWDPLSRFLPTADGWVRLHGNYPHHRARLLAALGLPDDTADPAGAVAAAVAERSARDVEDTVTAGGGLAVAVRTPHEWAATPQGRAADTALLSLRRIGDAPIRPVSALPGSPLRPAAGLRVLDLTRVIAGPVGTRTLALLGADVLRVDSPRLPEIPAGQLDTGFGKRSALLDLDDAADRSRFDDLLHTADVVVTGYRPGALDRHGLAPAALLERRPGLVVATLSAWGTDGPWSGRRGFDSLVQAASGIAVLEGGADGSPGVLPAQALDHGAGYLLAAAVLRAVANRIREGGGWHASLSLAQVAAWLQRAGRAAGTDRPAGATPDPAPWLEQVAADAGTLTYALPPVHLGDGPRTWASPPVTWGTSAPAWRTPGT